MKNLVKRFMTSALLGFSAFISSGISLAHSHQESAQQKPATLHASDDALRAIGTEYKDNLLEWAGRDVLLLTDKDFKEVRENEEKKNPGIDFMNIDFYSVVQERFSGFSFGSFDPHAMTYLAYQSINGAPFALGFGQTETSRENTHCIIVIRSEPMDALTFAAMLASQEDLKIENIFSTKEEFATFMIAHEAQHCGDAKVALSNIPREEAISTMIKEEGGADQSTIRLLAKKNEKGKSFVSEHTFDEWINLRSIGSFSGITVEYSFSGYLDKNQSSELNQFDSKRAQEILEARSLIWNSILSKVPDIRKNAIPQLEFIQDSLRDVAKSTEYNLDPHPLLIDVDRVLSDWIIYPSKANDPETILEVNTTLMKVKEALGKSTNPYERQITLIAPTIMSSYFTLQETYGIISALNSEGAFKSKPLAQKEIDIFIHAVERHFPSQAIKQKPSIGFGG